MAASMWLIALTSMAVEILRRILREHFFRSLQPFECPAHNRKVIPPLPLELTGGLGE
jgi:hypothetical protein